MRRLVRLSILPLLLAADTAFARCDSLLDFNESGHEVVVTYRQPRPLLDQLRQKGIVTIAADFSGSAGITAFADVLRERYSSLRARVHNASEWLAEGGELSDHEVLRRMFSVHVNAPYPLNQRCGELLCRHGEAHGQADIIHTSYYVASIGSRKHIAYPASKAAQENLTLSFAARLAPLVKVNSIAPAMLMFNDDDDDAYREKALRKSLLGIAPGASEGVAAIRYLLDSRYVTGKTIAVDGGRHLARAS